MIEPTIYQRAPELLLNKMAEVNGVLAKQDQKSKSYIFWKSVYDIMLYCYGFMNDLKYVFRQNDLLTAENNFLKEYAADLRRRLDRYEITQELLTSGELEQVADRVRKKMNDEGIG